MAGLRKKLDLARLGLEPVRWFVAAAEAGSLSRAARQANVAQSTVSRALGRLEAALGLELVSRSGRAFRLTDAGAALLPVARDALANVEEMARIATDARGVAGGAVRLDLCTALGRHVLLPALATWHAERPSVTLHVRFDELEVDPRATGVDIVVRAGRPKDSALARTSLGDYGHVLVAAPGYLRRRGTPRSPDDLRDHHVIAMRLERAWTSWPFRRDTELVTASVVPRITVTDADALRELACDEAGLTVLPDYLAAPALRAGALVHVLGAWTLPRIPVHAFHHATRRAPRAVTEILDVLRDVMAALRG